MTPQPRRRPQRDAAWLWLRAMLMRGPLPSCTIRQAAEDAGFSWRTIQRARAADPTVRVWQHRQGWHWSAPRLTAAWWFVHDDPIIRPTYPEATPDANPACSPPLD